MNIISFLFPSDVIFLGAGYLSRTEVMNLLERGAIEIVPPAQRESGFYSRYFLVPKKEGDLWPILDFRFLNHALMKRSFRMITLKQILAQICPGDWFMLLDLKDAYFHIQVAPPSQTILEIRIRKGGISIQGPTIWSVPGSPHFYARHGCGTLPFSTDGKIYAAAIAAFHASIAGWLVGRDSAVIQFLRGARRMNPPHPRTVPSWDLPTVLRALKGPPF